MKDPLALKIERVLRSPALLVGLAVAGGVGLAVVVGLVWLLPPVQRFLGYLVASQFWFSILLMVGLLNLILTGTAVCILAERKISAYIQDRHGPSRVGFLGVFQPAADGLKFFLKEDVIPRNVDLPLYLLAPTLAFVVALLGFAIIPWAGDIHWPWMPAGETVLTQVAGFDIGFLYLIAVGSMGVYGVVLAGYAANNKYSFYGGMRAAAQMISYEIPLGLGLLCILLTAGTLRLEEVVDAQARSGLWFVFYQPLPCLLVLISGFAETNRAPFDLAEAEQELVGGFHTEYSAMKFGLFFLGEYAHMITNSALLIALFLGGWHLWLLPGVEQTAWWAAIVKFCIFWAKIAAMIAFYMVIRWTLPRFRFDQLMRVAWQSMVPMGMALLVGTAVLVALDLHRVWWASLLMNAVVLLMTLVWVGRSRSPVTGRQQNLPDVEVRPT
ncbi:MAG: NADH-quinone oxidoreductase subunit NuoH [Phycisphaerae bacterium]|jgi:NADH-quinone oxidoreductase subunit H